MLLLPLYVSIVQLQQPRSFAIHLCLSGIIKFFFHFRQHETNFMKKPEPNWGLLLVILELNSFKTRKTRFLDTKLTFLILFIFLEKYTIVIILFLKQISFTTLSILSI